MSLVMPIFVRGGEGSGSLNFRGVAKKRESPDFRSPEVMASLVLVLGDDHFKFSNAL